MKQWLKETSTDEIVRRYKKAVDVGGNNSHIMELLEELDSRGIDIQELVRNYEGQYRYELFSYEE